MKRTPATWLSDLRRIASRVFRLPTALARQSHGSVPMLLGLAGSAASATGCLVAEAPEYGPPQQRPPVVNWEGVVPPPYDLVVFEVGDQSKTFTVPVRSEDAGDPLQGTLWVDWSVPGREEPIWDKPIPASSYDKVDRSWSYSFLPDDRIERGCGHTLTLLLVHSSNYDAEQKKPKEGASWDVASVTWQLNVLDDDEPSDPNVIEPCLPTSATSVP